MSEKTKKNSFQLIIVVLLVLLLIVGGTIAYQLISKNKQIEKEEATGLFRTIEQDPNVIVAEGGKSISERLEEMQKEVDEGHVSLNMNVTMVVEENSRIGEIYLENPIANRHDIFVTVFLDESQSIIGQTGVIPRGSAIKTIELDKTLKKGTHEATITYNLIDEEKQVVEQASVGIQIIVR